jgi:hypothetical protein
MVSKPVCHRVGEVGGEERAHSMDDGVGVLVRSHKGTLVAAVLLFDASFSTLSISTERCITLQAIPSAPLYERIVIRLINS